MENDQADAGRDGSAKIVSRDQVLWREQGRANVHFPVSADHEQDWQPYPVDPDTSCHDHILYTYIQGAEYFMAKWIAAEEARAGLRHAVVCPNVTGRTKEKIVQSKRARAGSLALVD